ncbi:MAG: VOC family protein [Balneolaceae bacterium]
MEIDHLFIFSNDQGKEADQLIDFGFTEGSTRIHQGQGTKNRKFYFKNFFLELLWVIDEYEIQSESTSVTKLWERSKFQLNGNSRFGLCLVNSSSTDKLFKKGSIYQPEYFPKGISIDFIANENNPTLPWTFRLPYRGKQKSHSEPTSHSNGIQLLTKTEFEISSHDLKSPFISHLKELSNIKFKKSERSHLTLEFDNVLQRGIKEFPTLGLTIKY